MSPENVEEPGLITVKPVTLPLKRVKTTQIREHVWSRQSRSVKSAVIALSLLLVAGLVFYYNLFITELFDVHLETAQMEAEVQRKNILIPDLAKVVEDYMAFEGRVFVHAADVRSALAPFKEKMADGAHSMDTQTFTRFKAEISRFQAVAESYPVLRSSETYQKLMLELANTETRMTSARNRYNFAVNRYNTGLALVPGCLFGYLIGFRQVKTFVAEKPN